MNARLNVQQQWANLVMRFAAIILIGMMTACGGGGGSDGAVAGSGTSGTKTPVEDAAVVPDGGKTEFTSLGMDEMRTSMSNGDMGALVDPSMRITLSNMGDDASYHYNFTFDSGLPGGIYSSGTISCSLCTITNGSAGKIINILAPKATKFVQNVFWTDINDPYIFGFGEAGYFLPPNTFTWPTSGTSTYKGKAFQYLVNSPFDPTYSPDRLDGNALFSSDVTATVDYSAKTILIHVVPDATRIHITENSNVKNLALNQLGFDFPLHGVGFSSDVLQFDHFDSSNIIDFSVKALGFFGPHAENLAGVMSYDAWVPPIPLPGNTWYYLAFALTKQ